MLEEVNLSRDKEVILSNEVEVEEERKEEEEGWADKAMTSVYGIVSYLGGAVAGRGKGVGSSQQVQGRRSVGDGRRVQGKQGARVVKKKGLGVGKRGDGGVAKGILQMEQQIQAGSHMKTAGVGGGWATPPGVSSIPQRYTLSYQFDPKFQSPSRSHNSSRLGQAIGAELFDVGKCLVKGSNADARTESVPNSTGERNLAVGSQKCW